MRGGRSSTRDDFDKVKDSLHKLKTENRKLKRENALLRKELSRTIDLDFDKSIANEDEDCPKGFEEPSEIVISAKCGKCKQQSVKIVPAGKFEVLVCTECGFKRKRVSST